jgi:putative FmdB family regulatory protein
MPIYEYTCHDCQRKVSLLWRSYADAQSREPVCPRCGGTHLTRLISRVAVLRSQSSDLGGSDASGGPDDLAGLDGLDENDPKSLARFMRKMADETGEDLGPEFAEVVGRLEAGEDPESIEQSMPDLGGGDTAGAGPGADDFGVM